MPRAMSNALDAVNYTKAPKACCARALVRMLKVFDCSLDQDGNTTSYKVVCYTSSLDCGGGRISELCCTAITQHPDLMNISSGVNPKNPHLCFNHLRLKDNECAA